MKNNKNRGIVFLKILLVCLLAGALIPTNPYGYYILLRWISCAAFTYFALLSYHRKAMPWVWIFGVLAGIYNPILQTHLSRELWSVVNIASILLIIIHSIKSKQIQNQPNNNNKNQVLNKAQAMLSKLLKISNWYRILIVSSVVWVVVTLINTNPWATQAIRHSTRVTRRVRRSRYSSGGDLSETVNNWGDFFLYGILPIVLFWGFFWIIQGIRKKKFEFKVEKFKNILNKVIVILAFVAACFGGYNGLYYAEREFKPTIREVFSSFTWDNVSTKKYYEVAEDYVKDRINLVKNENSNISMNGKILKLSSFPPVVEPKDLPNFNKKPPQYNERVFKEAFPKSLQSPIHIIGAIIAVGSITAFVVFYGALHFIMFTMFWVIDSFFKNNRIIEK